MKAVGTIDSVNPDGTRKLLNPQNSTEQEIARGHTKKESLHQETLPSCHPGSCGADHGPEHDGRAQDKSIVEALQDVGHRIGADQLAKVEDGRGPAKPRGVYLGRADRRIRHREVEVGRHAKERCTPQNSLVVVDQTIACKSVSVTCKVALETILASSPMTMAGMRKRSIFLRTRFSTLGSIDLASSPTKSIVGVAMLAASFDVPESTAAAPFSMTGDAVMLKNLSKASVDWLIALT